MKKTLMSAIAVAMLLGMPSASAVAQDDTMDPLIVVWAKSFNTLIENLDVIGNASNNPDLGQGLEGLLNLFTQGSGLAGIDKERPWGASVATDGFQFQILAFLPITDLEQFVQVLGAAGGDGPQDEGDGIYSVSGGPLPMALYLKQVGDWSYVAQAPEVFDNLPEDPTKVLAGLHEKYDAGMKAYVQNIPEIFRQLAVEQIKVAAEERLNADAASDDIQAKLQAEILRKQLDSLGGMMEDTEEVTFGAVVNEDTNKGNLEIIITAVEGSAAAAEYAKMSTGRSNYAGFIVPDAAASMNATLVLTESDKAEAKGSVDEMRAKAMEQVDGLSVIPDKEIADRLKGLVNEFFDVIVGTIDAGNVDAGMTVLGEGPYTMLGGIHVADGEKLSGVFEQFVELVETEAGFYGVQLDVAKHDDIRFHTLMLPYLGGEQGEMLDAMFGDEMEVTLGLSPQAAYVCIGSNGVDRLKTAIEASSEARETTVPPVQLHASAGMLLELLSKSGSSDPTLAAIAVNIPEDSDQVHVTVAPIPNGMLITVDAESGALGIIGTALMNAGPLAGLGGL